MRTLFFIAISAILFASCGNQTAEAPKEKMINGDSLLKVVNDFDANIKAGYPIVKMSREQLKGVVSAYKELALITTDRNTQVMYFEKAGSISGEAHFNEEVKSCFESAFAIENDPEKLAELHYTYAFINDAKLKQFDIARQEYQLLITDFSTSFWAEQAKMALEVLGKTDEEILAAFKEKNKP
jgi:tetratricopeptide (TPR) repeat protein